MPTPALSCQAARRKSRARRTFGSTGVVPDHSQSDAVRHACLFSMRTGMHASCNSERHDFCLQEEAVLCLALQLLSNRSSLGDRLRNLWLYALSGVLHSFPMMLVGALSVSLPWPWPKRSTGSGLATATVYRGFDTSSYGMLFRVYCILHSSRCHSLLEAHGLKPGSH